MNDEIFPNKKEQIYIEDEIKKSYLDYAMSVIVGRALPDVRDGLKPVHRRIIYAMHEQSNYHNRPYKKSARIVGDVIGKYHPHGESAVYDALVRLAQPFSLRYPLVEGQGNFGSIDGDPPAAMRYTEVRMQKITDEMIADLDKDTVDFELNYDDRETMPSVMPTKIPNLLVNGSSGIAVGMATNIPPHNLGEILSACLALLKNENISIDELMEHLPGPDFPTGATISGTQGIKEAYKTGKGRLIINSKYHIESKGNKHKLIITEIPYQLNKIRLLERIAELVKEKIIEGISELRDESNHEGIRIVIELKAGEIPEVVYNNLLINSPLRTSFSINMVALVDGQPRQVNLKDILESFLKHRREVISRRSIFELNKSKTQANLLEGLTVALANIDPIIEMIKASSSQQEARINLVSTTWKAGDVIQMIERVEDDIHYLKSKKSDISSGLIGDSYRLSEAQAQAILDMRLHRLTSMEQEKIFSDYRLLIDTIKDLIDILSNPDRLTQIIEDDLTMIRSNYSDNRLTEIIQNHEDIKDLDLIVKKTVAITLSREGYIKTQDIDYFRSQKRGGKGKLSSSLKEEDIIENLIVTDNHTTLLCFSDLGKVYWLRVIDIPFASSAARGRPIINLLKIDENEKITAILPLSDGLDIDKHYITMVTKLGTIKRTVISEFSRPRNLGLIAISLVENDQLVDAIITNGQKEIMLFSSGGNVNRFQESNIRALSRNTMGVIGIRMNPNERVVTMLTTDENKHTNSQAESQSYHIITVCANGFGKASPIEDFPTTSRGTKGVIGIKTSNRNGELIGAKILSSQSEMLLISHQGIIIRIDTESVPKQKRNTQGVKLMNLDDNDYIMGLSLLLDEEDDVDTDK